MYQDEEKEEVVPADEYDSEDDWVDQATDNILAVALGTGAMGTGANTTVSPSNVPGALLGNLQAASGASAAADRLRSSGNRGSSGFPNFWPGSRGGTPGGTSRVERSGQSKCVMVYKVLVVFIVRPRSLGRGSFVQPSYPVDPPNYSREWYSLCLLGYQRTFLLVTLPRTVALAFPLCEQVLATRLGSKVFNHEVL